MSEPRSITIISGGQTGADRAALDFALETDRPHGGWCPRGRLAEDGPIAPCYDLRETPSRRYSERTEWNVRDSDATVVFTSSARVAGGTRLAAEFARRFDKPTLYLRRDCADSLDEAAAIAAASLREFLGMYAIERLNIAGPRASQQPTIAAFVGEVLRRAFDA